MIVKDCSGVLGPPAFVKGHGPCINAHHMDSKHTTTACIAVTVRQCHSLLRCGFSKHRPKYKLHQRKENTPTLAMEFSISITDT